MAEAILRLDEVKKIAKEFVRREWNAELMEFKSILLTTDRILYDVDGRAGTHQQDMKTKPPEAIDTIIEFSFKLQITSEDGQVRGFQREQSQSSRDFSPQELRDQSLRDAQEDRERAEFEYYEEKTERLRDEENSDEYDPLNIKEMGKKWGFDGKKFGL